MTTVIICNQLSRLKATLGGTSGPLRYISLVDTRESLRICSYLRERPNAQELSRAQLFRERSGEFRNKYIEFMGACQRAKPLLTLVGYALYKQKPPCYRPVS